MFTLLSSLIAALVGIAGFLLGRAISESEKVLAEKRRVYEAFLLACPRPNSAYEDQSEEEELQNDAAMHRDYAPLLLYAAPSVAMSVSIYLRKLAEARLVLSPESPPLHPVFKDLAQSHNDIVLEMRRDALAWSAFGYWGKSRLPEETLKIPTKAETK